MHVKHAIRILLKIKCQVKQFAINGSRTDTNELKDFKKIEKVLISARILFKKIAIMHGKGEFSKIKGTICNVPKETVKIYIF